jgi:hypothetical protein
MVATGFFVALSALKMGPPALGMRAGFIRADTEGIASVPRSIISENHTPLKGPQTRRLAAYAGAKSAIVSGVDDELIKVLPELGRVAYVRGLGGAFVIWTLLRAVDRAGTRYIERETALRYLSRNGITRRKITHAVQAQKRIGITLFEIHPTRIEYVGQKKLAAALGASRAVRPQMIRRMAAQNISTFYSAVYAAWLAAVGDKYGGLMISRARLCELWSLGETQLRKWEKREGIIVQSNVGRFDTPAEHDESAETKRLLSALPRDRNGEAHSWEYGGSTWFASVNRYIVPFAMGTPMGATRKAARRAKNTDDAACAVDKVATAKSEYRRVFFSQAWLNAKPWQMSVGERRSIKTGEDVQKQRLTSLIETGECITTRRHLCYGVFDACSMRPRRRGALL